MLDPERYGSNISSSHGTDDLFAFEASGRPKKSRSGSHTHVHVVDDLTGDNQGEDDLPMSVVGDPRSLFVNGRFSDEEEREHEGRAVTDISLDVSTVFDGAIDLGNIDDEDDEDDSQINPGRPSEDDSFRQHVEEKMIVLHEDEELLMSLPGHTDISRSMLSKDEYM
eukprot:gnl/Carplike_NY0171/5231_a7141_316.p1 GENE.gnl/Carplike_NY0171/5231_a7141_316~~gnl/Carplike_NY0171/5231_a7141_316.p1  ORF type:complete len:184 (+),score=70.48 gnl/Carplike_NY0171/5231_a7141_316:53-553(+)